MRLPLSRVYRAFPELDRFSDELCETYVQRTAQRHSGAWGALNMLALGIAIVSTMIVVTILAGRNRPGGWSPHPTLQLCMALAAPTLGAIGGLVIRDRWLRARLRRALNDTNCDGCTYSLLGLPLTDGFICCPECGRRMRPAERGLTPADFLSEAPQGPPAAR
ncbi:MAG: hypothetical protein KIT68_09440 [Phycisphaeraceae bacterium]|nr:hypothetical protein [Phycisphaeraceae bacterium]